MIARGCVAHAPQQVGPGRMGKPIFSQVAPGEDRVDQRESCRRAVAHGDRGGAIQLDHWRRIRLQ